MNRVKDSTKTSKKWKKDIKGAGSYTGSYRISLLESKKRQTIPTSYEKIKEKKFFGIIYMCY